MSNENKETYLLNAVLNVGSHQMKEFLLCELCVIVGCSSVFSLKLRLASQRLSTSHCNYCACSLDIFHKNSQIAKFFLREGKRQKKEKLWKLSYRLIISSPLNTGVACL